MICGGHEERWEKVKLHTVFWMGNIWERGHSLDLGLDDRIILK